MKHLDLQTGLRGLNESLGRMRGLLAWSQLKQQEARPSEPPSFQMYDTTATDLRNEYSHFSAVSLQVHGILHEPSASLPMPVRETLLRKLAQLEQEAHQLHRHGRCLGY